MYGKIFAQMYDGTLAENWKALITFQQMIILCDDQGIIDMTPNSISSRTGIPLEYIKEGIEFLEKEDPYSRRPDEGGKRIVLIDDHRPWGWRIVNHLFYRKMSSYEDKKRADRERIAEKRRAMSQDVANSSEESDNVENVANVAHTDTNTNTDTNKTPLPPKGETPRYSQSFETFWSIYPKKVGKDAAYRSWQKIGKRKDVTPTELINAIDAQVKAGHFKGSDGNEFFPNPSTWLNQGRWQDEIKTSQAECGPSIGKRFM